MLIMSADGLKILAVSALTVIFAGNAYAQPKSFGTAFSFNGIGLSYEHCVNDETFIELSVKTMTGEAFMDREQYPGVSASFTWNMIMKTWDSRNGERIDFFAGPGLAAGWSKDLLKERGFHVGLAGRVGVQCSFSRNIEISACVAPVLGIHMVFLKESIRMEYYRYGLINMVMPEIGIRYRF